MKKIISLYILLGIIAVVRGAENQQSEQPETTIEIKSLELDGFRYIKQLHNDVEVSVFSNNGVRGTGLVLSFFGEFNLEIHDVKNIQTEKVILENGIQLDSKKIRKQLSSPKFGNDKKSFGFRVDLDIDQITNIKHISGKIEVVQAEGIIEQTSGLIKDEVKSKEDKLGISIDLATNSGNGRYYVLLIENADYINELDILDENGNVLKQTSQYNVFGMDNERVKVYVDKEKGKPFAVRLKRAKKMQTQTVPYVIENIDLMSY